VRTHVRLNPAEITTGVGSSLVAVLLVEPFVAGLTWAVVLSILFVALNQVREADHLRAERDLACWRARRMQGLLARDRANRLFESRRFA
jgi:hypothetical protein